MRSHCYCALISIIFCMFSKSEEKNSMETECNPIIYGCSGEILGELIETLKGVKQTNEMIKSKLTAMEYKLKEQKKVIHEQSFENVEEKLKAMMTEIVQREMKSIGNDFRKSFTNVEENFNNQFNIIVKKISDTSREFYEKFELKINSIEDGITKTLQASNQNLEETLNKKFDFAIQSQNKSCLKDLQTPTPQNIDKQLISKPYENCAEVSYNNQNTESIYKLNVPGLVPFDAFCMHDPFDNNSPTWTIVQRRVSSKESFDRNWNDYKNGFGNLKENFWLGLERLYVMTAKQNYELWIYMTDFGNRKITIKYNKFVVGNEKEGYPLSELGEYSGDVTEGLTKQKGQKFTTKDSWYNVNFANQHSGGWWYSQNSKVNLNGIYGTKEINKGICWISHTGKCRNMVNVHMAIRPKRI